uniref:Uncharacterized protein n=1 Tax=Magallana gigas TaxID=29159 RepID=A0A8W8LZU2_MAGGI
QLEHVSALIRVQQQDVNVDPDVNVVTGVNVQAAKSSVTAADLVVVVKDALDRKTANAQTIPDVAAKSSVTAAVSIFYRLILNFFHNPGTEKCIYFHCVHYIN